MRLRGVEGVVSEGGVYISTTCVRGGGCVYISTGWHGGVRRRRARGTLGAGVLALHRCGSRGLLGGLCVGAHFAGACTVGETHAGAALGGVGLEAVAAEARALAILLAEGELLLVAADRELLADEVGGKILACSNCGVGW